MLACNRLHDETIVYVTERINHCREECCRLGLRVAGRLVSSKLSPDSHAMLVVQKVRETFEALPPHGAMGGCTCVYDCEHDKKTTPLFMNGQAEFFQTTHATFPFINKGRTTEHAQQNIDELRARFGG